jgi:predicted CopG family antitoxin
MSVKTITIDLEAYEALSRIKGKGESFSRVIKRLASGEKKTARRLLENLSKVALAPDTINHVRDIIRDRKRELVDFAPLDG